MFVWAEFPETDRDENPSRLARALDRERGNKNDIYGSIGKIQTGDAMQAMFDSVISLQNDRP